MTKPVVQSGLSGFSPKQAVFDIALLLFAYRIAIILRGILPIGEDMSASRLSDSPIAHLILPLAWLLGLLVLAGLSRWRKLPGQPTLRILVLIFSAVSSYFVLRIMQVSVSRVLFIYFFFIALFFLFAIRNLTFRLNSYPHFSNFFLRQGSVLDWFKFYLRKINTLAYKVYVELILAVSVGIYGGLHALRMGLSFSPDSVEYLRSAMNFAYLHQWDQSPLWPPLYSFFVAMLIALKPFPADSAAALSAICMLIFLSLFALMLREVSKNSFVNFGILLMLATLKEFYFIFYAVWSDQLFVVCLALNFYLILIHRRTGEFWWFVLAATSASLAMVTRYAGLGLGITMVFYAYFFLDLRTSKPAKLVKYGPPLILSFMPLLIVFAQNYFVHNTLTGRSGIKFEVVNTVSTLGATFLHDLGFPVLFLLVLMILFRFYKPVKNIKPTGLDHLFFLFIAGYILFILLFSITTTVSLGSRVLSPSYFYFSAYLAYMIQFLFFRSEGRQFWIEKVVPTIVVFSLVISLASRYWNIDDDFFDDPRNAQASALSQREEGFDLSSTARGFSDYFYEVFLTRDTILVAVALEDTGFSRSFLYKGALFDHPQFVDHEFTNISSLEYDLVLYERMGSKRIHFLDFLFLPGTSLLNDELLAKVGQFDPMPLHLVVSDAWFELNRLNPDMLVWPDGIVVRSQLHIEPYWVFEIWFA